MLFARVSTSSNLHQFVHPYMRMKWKTYHVEFMAHTCLVKFKLSCIIYDCTLVTGPVSPTIKRLLHSWAVVGEGMCIHYILICTLESIIVAYVMHIWEEWCRHTSLHCILAIYLYYIPTCIQIRLSHWEFMLINFSNFLNWVIVCSLLWLIINISNTSWYNGFRVYQVFFDVC